MRQGVRWSLLILLKRDRKRLNHEDDAGIHLYGKVLDALNVLELFKHHGQDNFCFEAGEWCPNAEVNAMSEGEMAVWLTLDIERVGVRKLGRIAVG